METHRTMEQIKELRKEYKKQYYQNNKNEISKRHKHYYKKNKNEISKQQAEYRALKKLTNSVQPQR